MNSKWWKNYNLAKAYYETNGNLEIPTTHVSEDGTKLGIWIFMQRQAYKNRTIPKEKRTNRIKPLTDEQVRLLEDIGMIWELQTTKITKSKQIKLEKLFLKVLNDYIKKHKNEIESYEDIKNIEQEFIKILFQKSDNTGKQKIK